MSGWEIRFHEFLAQWLRDKKHLPCDKVTGTETEKYEWWDYSDAHGISVEFVIYWVDEKGQNYTERFNGGIEELFWRD